MQPIFANRQIDVLGHKFELSLSVQFAAFSAMIFLLAYAVLFSGFPPIHDSFHAFRHSFGIIPCH